ncbi:MAG TPA: DUF3037 domain-containing protein [Sphingobacteriaceae bacterium]
MHNHLFEYAVIRVVPRVEREEFMNIGVILYCSGQKFLNTLFALDEKRLQALYSDIDITELEEHLNAFKRICDGAKEGGPIASLDPASRFRWLTATRSTIIQTSKVHPGFCLDPEKTLKKLFAELVR